MELSNYGGAGPVWENGTLVENWYEGGGERWKLR